MAYVTYQIADDLDAKLKERQRRIAERRGVPVKRVSKSGVVLRELLAIAEAAELLGIRPVQQPDQAQP